MPDGIPNGWSEAQVQTVRDAASDAWPDLPAPGPDFIGHVADRVEPDEVPALRVGDFYLAYLCARGEPGALATFERVHRRAVTSALRRVRQTKLQDEDLRQIVRRHLLVGDNAAIRGYGGKGSLAAWVGVVSLRAVINATRGKPRPESASGDSEDLAALAEVADPELDYLRARYRADFREAFARAVASLEPRQRSVLHQHLVERLTVRDMAKIYGVNSGSVSRWITKARERLADETAAGLQAQLSVSPAELQSIMRLIRSRVALSLSRVFGDAVG